MGIDPGGGAGGVAVVDDDGALAWLAQYRKSGRNWRYWTCGASGLVEGACATLGATLAACMAFPADVCAVEAVGRYAGKPAPLALAASAGAAVGIAEAAGAIVVRPRPEAWRVVYYGRPAKLDTDRAKRVALDFLHGRPHAGSPAGYTLARREWPIASAAEWSEHAAEAAGIAAWLQWAAP